MPDSCWLVEAFLQPMLAVICQENLRAASTETGGVHRVEFGKDLCALLLERRHRLGGYPAGIHEHDIQPKFVEGSRFKQPGGVTAIDASDLNMRSQFFCKRREQGGRQNCEPYAG